MSFIDELDACLHQKATISSEMHRTAVWAPANASALADAQEMLGMICVSPC